MYICAAAKCCLHLCFTTDELDSYMYQSVGHHAIDAYSEALGLPLYRRVIQGTSVALGAVYQFTAGDEVEDLYELLRDVQVNNFLMHEPFWAPPTCLEIPEFS